MGNDAGGLRLFLVGPMGSGKSTVGRHLADLLDCPFIDSDAEIESRAGADIPWIFDVEGEAGFRRRETTVLKDLVEQPAAVIMSTTDIHQILWTYKKQTFLYVWNKLEHYFHGLL